MANKVTHLIPKKVSDVIVDQDLEIETKDIMSIDNIVVKDIGVIRATARKRDKTSIGIEMKRLILRMKVIPVIDIEAIK